MTTSTGAVGLGVLFKVGDGASPEVFTAVANVVNINISGRSVEEVDFTHLASDNAFREFRAGFKDPGEISMTCHYNPGNATLNGVAGLEYKLNTGDLFNFQIDMSGVGGIPNATDFDYILAGTGYVSGGDYTFSGEDPITFDVTIRISGSMTFTAA